MPDKNLFFRYQDFEIRDFAFFQSHPCLIMTTSVAATTSLSIEWSSKMDPEVRPS
jgi:hypothetical protein